MKSVLISIQPKWCELIASGKKTVEVRKSRPKLGAPFKCYIYCTRQKVNGEILLTYDKKVEGRNRGFRDEGDIPLAGKVIGEFVCRGIDRMVHCGTCNRDIRLRLVDENFNCKELDYTYLSKCKLHYPEIDEYSSGGDVYGWHITNLVIYDKPRELSEFKTVCEGLKPYQCDKCEYSYTENTESGSYEECCCNNLKPLKRPPQSWCYVESEVEGE